MPRAERRSPRRSGSGWSLWWLALPALGIAAWAAFSATLALLGEDASRAPSAVGHDAESRLPLVVPPAPAAVAGPGDGEPAAAPPGSAVAADGAASGTGPSATATPATQRAAADDVRRVKPKRAPQEHLTDQDRRALDAIVEQAGKSAR